MAILFAEVALASSLSINPATPTSADTIDFNVSYEDPGYAFDGSSVVINDRNISITYRQTGYAGFPPFVYYFKRSIGPLAPGEYTVQVFWEHRFDTGSDYASPVLVSDVKTFSVSDATPDALEVVEYFHEGLSHYFITAYREEIAQLDGMPGLGWERTNERFRVFPSSTRRGLDVCRFYGSVRPGPNSHFYTVDPQECQQLKSLQAVTPASEPRWNFEGLAFSVRVPENGNCTYSDFAIPVQRFYNHQAAHGDASHRYTVSTTASDSMRARGWINEGVVMCVAP